MGKLATDIHLAAQAIPPAPVTDPAALLTGPQLAAIFGKVEAAVAALELLTRGARIVRVAGVPDDARDGVDGDLALNTKNADLYGKDAGVWSLIMNLKGLPGKDAAGKDGLNAYQLAVQQGFVGTVTQWLDSLGKAGDPGKSAYRLALDNGFKGTVAQWLDSLKGDGGDPGQDGNTIRWEGFAPTNEPAQVGDMWVHSISATKCAFYKCTDASGVWSLRFTSPDAQVVQQTQTQTGGGTVKSVSVNGGAAQSPDANGNVNLTVQAAGGGTVKTVNGVAPDANGNVTISTGGTSSGGSSYTDAQAVNAINTSQASSKTVQAANGVLEIKPGSITIDLLDSNMLSNGNLTVSQKDTISNAANWNGKMFIGNLANTLRGQFFSDANYFYMLVQDNAPVRFALS